MKTLNDAQDIFKNSEVQKIRTISDVDELQMAEKF